MINREALKKLIETYGSYNKASQAIGISAAGLCRLVKGSRDIGKDTLRILVEFCTNNNLKITDYIFLS